MASRDNSHTSHVPEEPSTNGIVNPSTSGTPGHSRADSPIAHRIRSRLGRQRRTEIAPFNITRRRQRRRPPPERSEDRNPSPVNIRLEVVNSAMLLLPTSRRLAQDPPETCTICLDDIVAGNEVSSMECSHSFHLACIGRWLLDNNTCPLCRHTNSQQEYLVHAYLENHGEIMVVANSPNMQNHPPITVLAFGTMRSLIYH
ncbi:uncharacterized protein LOC143785956 [Ranitomeya variabilis]|uniref:uncharacterized protein LOC143785956 n=1 Tax=Ranitomeya variabilis TaxID=490064 RepID=UPI0040562DCB